MKNQHCNLMNVEKKLKTLLENYVKSINDCNLDLASEIWNLEDRISFIHPVGYEHNFDEIKENFYLKTMNERFSKRDLRIKDLKYTIYGTTAIVEFCWDFYATVKQTNENIIHKGRETQFLVLKDDNWEITHIHYSTKPEL